AARRRDGRTCRTELERLRVTDVGRVRRERDDARIAVERPAAVLVEAPAVPVLLERPELRLALAARAQQLEHVIVQRRADAALPPFRHDVEVAEELSFDGRAADGPAVFLCDERVDRWIAERLAPN